MTFYDIGNMHPYDEYSFCSSHSLLCFKWAVARAPYVCFRILLTSSQKPPKPIEIAHIVLSFVILLCLFALTFNISFSILWLVHASFCCSFIAFANAYSRGHRNRRDGRRAHNSRALNHTTPSLYSKLIAHCFILL